MKQASVSFGGKTYVYNADTISDVANARIAYLEQRNNTKLSGSDRAAITEALRQQLGIDSTLPPAPYDPHVSSVFDDAAAGMQLVNNGLLALGLGTADALEELPDNVDKFKSTLELLAALATIAGVFILLSGKRR